MKLSEALPLAEMYLEKLAPATIRAEIVGSVKRCKPEVHDCEILLIPKPGYPAPEFGKPKEVYKTHLDKLLAEMQHDGMLRTANNPADGAKLKRREIVGHNFITGFNLELYIVTENTWGLQNMIRTGNSWFSHRAVTNREATAVDRVNNRLARGFLPNDLRYIKGKDLESGESCIMRSDETLLLPEERDVIELIFGKWIPPEERARYAESK